MKYDVFISHAQKDKSIAEAILKKLESAHLKCWSPSRDISVGEDWAQTIRNAIESSRLVVLLLSGNTNEARHIEREIAHAFYMRRPIIPFRLADSLPRREILFYLGNIPWSNGLNPPAEEDLEALTARIKGLMPGSIGAGEVAPAQDKRAAISTFSSSWFGAMKASHYQTLEIFKWVAIATFLCALVLFLWFAVRQTADRALLTENHRRSIDYGSSLTPTPSPPPGVDASGSKQTSTLARSAWWQAANGSPTPFVQGPQASPLNTPVERSANTTPLPQSDMTPGQRVAGPAAEPRPRRLPAVTHRVAHDHHQQFPGTQVKEARRIAELQNQRDSLQKQLKDIVANLLATQKKAELVTSQRDELQARLAETEQKRQTAQKKADLAAGKLDGLQDQLKEAENKTLTVQKSEELVRTQRDALQARLLETESAAQAAQKNADLATRQRDALQSELTAAKERVQLAETNANLAASQRDAMEAELEKKAEGTPEAQPDQHASDLAELPDSAPDTQFQAVRQNPRPMHQDGEFAQTLPPNPGQNSKPAPLTQTLDPFVQPTDPPRN